MVHNRKYSLLLSIFVPVFDKISLGNKCQWLPLTTSLSLRVSDVHSFFFDNSYFPFGPCQSLHSTQHDLITRKDDQKFSRHFKLMASSKRGKIWDHNECKRDDQLATLSVHTFLRKCSVSRNCSSRKLDLVFWLQMITKEKSMKRGKTNT